MSSISSLIFKLNRFLKRNTPKYKNGVSKAATITLNIKPLISKPLKFSQGIIPKAHNKINIVKVSTNCENQVEKLFLSHKCFPLVNRFQK